MPALEAVAKEFAGEARVLAHRTDVTSAESVASLADAVYDGFGACHVLCNNAGVGAPSAKVWQTTPNDWAWVFGVNVTGVVNGVLTFVPRMLESGEEGHVVNTSSSDGPISPLPSASVYAASKAAVSVLTECLAAQLAEEGAPIGASVFYPSGGLLRTGLWTSDRTRPPDLARERPRETEAMTPEKLEEMAASAGRHAALAAARRAGCARRRGHPRRAVRHHEGRRRRRRHAAGARRRVRRRGAPHAGPFRMSPPAVCVQK